jgi:hypothetical protein
MLSFIMRTDIWHDGTQNYCPKLDTGYLTLSIKLCSMFHFLLFANYKYDLNFSFSNFKFYFHPIYKYFAISLIFVMNHQ